MGSFCLGCMFGFLAKGQMICLGLLVLLGGPCQGEGIWKGTICCLEIVVGAEAISK